MKTKQDMVPGQQTGKAIEAKESVTLASADEAQAFFKVVRQRLQDVNRWNEMAEGITATFRLVDSKGTVLGRAPQKGDYFRIDIPGPGTKSGEGYDWVQIEEIMNSTSENEEEYGIRVRPTANPVNSKGDTAHFYSSQSTSTFLVSRKDNVIRAEVFDRNTKPNDEADSTFDRIRDAVVGTVGVLGFSKVQWEGLVKGLTAR